MRRFRPVDKLEFDAATHTYTVNGQVLPSVTQILDPYTGFDFVDPETLRIAAEFGTNVHTACHLYNTGELDHESLDPRVELYLHGWINFLEDTGATVIVSERYVWHPQYRYAGTLDSICYLGKPGHRELVDIKTGSSIPRTTGPQTAAYTAAWGEHEGEKIKIRSCVHLKPDTGRSYKLVQLDDPRDWPRFQAALLLHEWRAK